MADPIFNILIKYGLNDAAAKQAVKELNTVKEATKQAGEEGVKQEKDLQEQTKKTFTSKKQLKDMVKEIGQQFPILGQLGRLALNPIAFTTAAITAGFLLWNKRMQEAQRTLVGFELSPLEKQRVKVSEIAAAWVKVTEAILNAREKYNSADSKGDRALKNINDEFDGKTKLAKSEEEKAVIEDERDRKIAAQRQKNISDLRAESAAKMKQAEAIKVASVEEDDATQKQLEDNKTKAKADLEERLQRRSELADMEAGNPGMNPLQVQQARYQYRMRYGGNVPLSEAYAMEDAGIAEAKDVIARADAFSARRPERDRRRRYRSELLSQSADAAGRAETLSIAEQDNISAAASASANRWAGVGGNAGTIAAAAAGSDAILAGGKATAAQSEAINQAARLLGLQDQSSQVLLQILSRINDRQQSFINALRQVDDLRAQVQNLKQRQ